jgi:catechol 2,3-dioxygenase-like lactoylglutathione lyase family enzyme
MTPDDSSAPTDASSGTRSDIPSSFSHAFVHVRDVGRTRSFYVEHLGLEVLQEGGGYLRLGGGGGFHIGVEERAAAEIGAPGVELQIRVGDVDAVVERLRAARIAVTAPIDQPWGARHAWLHDPDGYRLSLWSPLAE